MFEKGTNVTENEAKRQSWELVNGFVACCSEHDCGLSDKQAKQAEKLIDWVAAALVKASKVKVTVRERPPFNFDDI